MEFEHCRRTLFGGPNDEALPEHPLYQKGLAALGHGICEVLNSSWAKEVMSQAGRSAERIWGDRFDKAYGKHDWSTRHFIVSFHDGTFECLADDFVVIVHKGPLPIFSTASRKGSWRGEPPMVYPSRHRQ